MWVVYDQGVVVYCAMRGWMWKLGNLVFFV